MQTISDVHPTPNPVPKIRRKLLKAVKLENKTLGMVFNRNMILASVEIMIGIVGILLLANLSR